MAAPSVKNANATQVRNAKRYKYQDIIAGDPTDAETQAAYDDGGETAAFARRSRQNVQAEGTPVGNYLDQIMGASGMGAPAGTNASAAQAIEGKGKGATSRNTKPAKPGGDAGRTDIPTHDDNGIPIPAAILAGGAAAVAAYILARSRGPKGPNSRGQGPQGSAPNAAGNAPNVAPSGDAVDDPTGRMMTDPNQRVVDAEYTQAPVVHDGELANDPSLPPPQQGMRQVDPNYPPMNDAQSFQPRGQQAQLPSPQQAPQPTGPRQLGDADTANYRGNFGYDQQMDSVGGLSEQDMQRSVSNAFTAAQNGMPIDQVIQSLPPSLQQRLMVMLKGMH